MVSKKDKKAFLHEGSDYLFSLNKFLGKKIVDVVGYPSDPFGDAPLFHVTQIIFDDGSDLSLEGEHDVVYLPADSTLKNMGEKTLRKFIEY